MSSATICDSSAILQVMVMMLCSSRLARLEVTLGRQPFPRHLIAERRHVAHTSRIDPVVIELEQRADGDRIVKGLIRPTRLPRSIDILLTDRRRVVDHLFYKTVERSVLGR